MNEKPDTCETGFGSEHLEHAPSVRPSSVRAARQSHKADRIGGRPTDRLLIDLRRQTSRPGRPRLLAKRALPPLFIAH